jgi:hypothetical protein
MPRSKKETKKERDERMLREIGEISTLLSAEETQRIKEAALEYSGLFPVFSAAVGTLIVGKLFGWKVLRIIHSGAVYAKYQRILGIQFAEVCPEEGPLWERSAGYATVKALNEFWKGVRGQIPLDDRQIITPMEKEAKK